jgi:hypothetical protein
VEGESEAGAPGSVDEQHLQAALLLLARSGRVTAVRPLSPTRRERAWGAGEARPAHRRRGDRPSDLRPSIRSGERRTENLHARVARKRLEGVCHPSVLGKFRGPLEEALHAGRPPA